ncbi:MAG: hypothetical protein COA69_03750 [Robiginitomaculum sp.]|nr:MAG: hypothetical protein COA69_03750 [Robiginitomaculum sp.]
MSRHLSKPTFRPLTKSAHKLSGFVLALTISLGALSVSAFANEYTINLNKTQILHLPGPAATIIVGNPDIADISVHSPDTLFVIGRGYGETNIIALDKFGQTILETNIIVNAGMGESGVRILNIGRGRKSYNCTPDCLPAPVLGDTPDFRAEHSGGDGGPINNSSAGPGYGIPPSGAPSAPVPSFPNDSDR